VTLGRALGYLGLWSCIGCAVFSAYVVVVFRTGAVYTAREQDGTLKGRIPLSGYLNMLFLLLGIVGLQLLANYFGLARRGVAVTWLSLFLLNLAHYLILFAFDTLVIDALVLSVWRPPFLQIPDAMGGESMKKHVLASLPVGIAAGLVLTALSTAISYVAIFRD
jgi:hypothetical protein